ncbi:MAG: L-aspartate oxidase [Clostridiales bacterium]|nr:L-aspartate oxidase [Clostridiales bacterium]
MAVFDVIIIGSGAAGLFCALKLSKECRVLIVTKKKLTDCNSFLAQSGLTTVLDESDKEYFIEDTLRTGRNENNIAAVQLLADRAASVFADLQALGVPFTTEEGRLCYTRESGHLKARIARAGDETGRHLIETLEKHVRSRENITIWEDTALIDILEDSRDDKKACAGVVLNKKGKTRRLKSKKTVLACGGVGGLFRNTTNHDTVTGDAIAIAYHHNITLKDLNRMQFHPTALYEGDRAERRFSISEALRWEGAKLLSPVNAAFIDPLAPPDTVTQAIRKQMETFQSPYVYLDISYRDRYFILERFPMTYEKCLSVGHEITFGAFPVSPAQHYFMGGIVADLTGKTSMAHLYAIGETSYTGVHGANRLAGNSLLEAFVFGEAAAHDINKSGFSPENEPDLYPSRYITHERLKDDVYKENLLKTLLVGEDAALYNELFDW